jgi:hypothetical protein
MLHSRRSLRTLLLTLTIALGATFGGERSARAEAGPFGLGLILGNPTGLSMKYYLGGTGHAIDGAIGGAFGGYGGLHLHVDYLFHPVMLTRSSGFNLPLHVGIGARVLDHNSGRHFDNDRHEDHLHVGARVPLGITFDFTRVPLDAFFEIAVILDFISGDSDRRYEDDNFGVDLNAALGIRYYF